MGFPFGGCRRHPHRAASATAARMTSVAAALLAAIGCALFGLALATPSGPPLPPRALGKIPAANVRPGRSGPTLDRAAHTVGADKTPPAASGLRPIVGALPASLPLAVSIPALGVSSNLLRLGLQSNGTVQVPDTFHEAGWYDLGVSPGSIGPAVILGHVDSYLGPGIFFRLGYLRPGDLVDVSRADGITAVFQVRAVRVYPKSAFPTAAVYGPLAYPGLRLITCGGPFDYSVRSYVDNIVVFAALVGSQSS